MEARRGGEVGTMIDRYSYADYEGSLCSLLRLIGLVFV